MRQGFEVGEGRGDGVAARWPGDGAAARWPGDGTPKPAVLPGRLAPPMARRPVLWAILGAALRDGAR